MSDKRHESRPGPLGSDDSERQFYTVMAEGLQGDKLPRWEDARRDFYDVSLGCQVGKTSEGHVAVLIVMEQEAADFLLKTATQWREKADPHAVTIGMGTFAMLTGLLGRLDG